MPELGLPALVSATLADAIAAQPLVSVVVAPVVVQAWEAALVVPLVPAVSPPALQSP